MSKYFWEALNILSGLTLGFAVGYGLAYAIIFIARGIWYLI